VDHPTSRISQWIYYLAAALYFTAVLLRTLIIYQDSPILRQSLVLLAAGLVLFLSEPALSRRWSGFFPIYLLIQTMLVFVLLALPGYSESFAALLGILSMQAMLNLNPRIGALWIGVCCVITWLLITRHYEVQEAAALAIIFTAANIFYGVYALLIRREQAAREQKLQLARELQAANQQLQDYSAQLEQMAVTQERHRFARELHDSVTQTVFSMMLTNQSAMLLLERDPTLVKGQLERLSQLVHAALVEIHALIDELKPGQLTFPGLEAGLRRLLADPRITENISVSLSVEGEQRLSVIEEQALLGITQEALNNILKHACTKQAQVRLHLSEPYWLEVEDQGRGFDLKQVRELSGMGLSSMRERAVEASWDLQVLTSPGSGTRIRVEKTKVREVQ
jgi:signal transduction histidine kinase